MMNFLADFLLPLAQNTAEVGPGWLSDFGWDGWLSSGTAAVLAALWVFMKILRRILSTLFMLCVVYLVLKCCFGVDLTPWLEPLFRSLHA
ncbi:MAG: hypothetical protein ACI4OS_03780 [Akkermansia sp.]